MSLRALAVAAGMVVLGFVVVYAWRQIGPDPDHLTVPRQTYPWQVEVLPEGRSTRVFGIELERTSLAEARQRLGADPKLALFLSDAGTASLEAYFDRVSLGGLSAKMVLGLQADADRIEAYAERGRKRQRAPTGGWRMQLAPEDVAEVDGLPVGSMTYIPAVNLEPRAVRGHFGEPAERIETEAGPTHWLYPGLGLDLALDPNAKELLQYVPPRDFERLRAPLLRTRRAGN